MPYTHHADRAAADLGTRVSQQITAAITGQKSVSAALAQSQRYAQTVGQSYR